MKTVFKILISALLLSVVWLFMSCGARKVNKQSSKEEIKTESVDNSVVEKQSDSNVKTETTIKVDYKNQTITEETEYIPSDSSKESFIIEKDGTKVVFNNVKKIVRKTTQNNNTKSELVNNIDELKKEAVKEQKVVKQVNVSKKENNSKEVKKEPFKPFNLVIIIAIVLFIIYLAYLIYKKLPLFPKF